MDIYTYSRMRMSDCVSSMQYLHSHPKLWFIRMYPPTKNVGVWDVTLLSNWLKLWFRLGIDYKFKLLIMALRCIDIIIRSQWCSIFHYHWRTATIKPRLLFPSCRLSATWGISLFSVVPSFKYYSAILLI